MKNKKKMSSVDEDRSLTSGIPIPQWMRFKTENYGFDPSTLSPPTHEGDFFYIKYPKPQPLEPPKLKTLHEVIEVKEKAFTQHTDSCKQFIPIIKDTVKVEKPKVTKPMGVDDGFKGDGAACGASVVEVAHQMLANKGKSMRTLTRVETEGNLAPPPSSHLRARRNSKSLPASPLSSPGGSPLTKRKNNPNNKSNRLFGLNFQSGESSLRGSDDDIDKKSGSSWILSSLFAALESKDVKKNSTKETADGNNSGKIVKYTEKSNSTTSVNEPIKTVPAVDTLATSATAPPKNSFFKSKPYLRDLNLLTPTSM